MKRCFVTCLLLGTIAACSTNPDVAKRESLERGERYLSQQQFGEALVELRKAVQIDPQFGQARFKLAETYLRLGDATNGYRESMRAADLLPNNFDAQMRAGELLLLAQKYEDARARADRALAMHPSSVDAHILRANALVGLKRIDAALEDARAAIEHAPERGATYATLGTIHLSQGNAQEAEASFKKAVAIDPRSLPARLALANYFWSAGKAAEAEAALLDAAAVAPRDPLVSEALAYFYLGSGRAAEAEKYLKVFADVAADAQGKIALAEYYMLHSRWDAARPILEGIPPSDTRNYPKAQLRLASVLLSTEKSTDAENVVDQLLRSQPRNGEALIAKARLLAAKRDLDKALETAKSAANVNPESSTVRLGLGKVHQARGEGEEAIAAYLEALRLNPRLVAADIEIARIHLAAGRLDQGVEFAQSAVAKAPSSFDGHLLLARALLRQNKPEAAEPSIRLLASVMPDSPSVQTEIAHMHLLKKDAAGARAAYQRVLAADSGNIEALNGIVKIDLANNRRSDAVKRLDDAIRTSPRRADLRVLLGRVYADARDMSAAESAVKSAIEVDPSHLDAYELLGRLYVVQGKLQQATNEYERVARQNPRSVGASTTVAILYQMQNRQADARAEYERILQVDPNAAVAANNLAWLYTETGGNLDAALQLAQTAKLRLPDRPEVNDTLGWIYHKKGLTSLAVTTLRQSVEKDPGNPFYHFHLGLAYATTGDNREARRALETALKLKPDFSGAAEARQVLANLKG